MSCEHVAWLRWGKIGRQRAGGMVAVALAADMIGNVGRMAVSAGRMAGCRRGGDGCEK